MSVNEIQFDIAAELIAQGLRGVYVVIRDVHNRAGNDDFEEYKQQRIKAVYNSLPANFVKSDPVLKGFRDLHTHFGFSNRNFPSAPEALFEFLLKFKQLPKVNLLVDVYNLVSVETRLALGAHDLAFVSGNIHLKPMTGQESYQPLGAPETKPVRAGGYSYIDDAGDVICMLDSKQVEKSRVTESTRDVFYIVQGNPATSQAYLLEGAKLLIRLTQKYCGGEAKIIYP
jgi:DNA/RNA-binding domain of Phe-tRNA-synthetase-like protein